VGSVPHGTPSGYSHHRCRCEDCVAAKKATDHEYYLRNAEAIKARTAAYAAANPDAVRERTRRYRAENAEQIRFAKQAYYEANREAIVAKVGAWVAANPERRRAQTARYRERHREERRADSLDRYYRQMETGPEAVRKRRREWAKTQKGILANRAARHARRGAPYTTEALDWIASLVDPVCAYCGRTATEIDHVVPVSLGGTGDVANLVPACRECNARKSNASLAEFMAAERGIRWPTE
jgi:5-methylcytosine-specific restriction endonuclease McrA